MKRFRNVNLTCTLYQNDCLYKGISLSGTRAWESHVCCCSSPISDSELIMISQSASSNHFYFSSFFRILIDFNFQHEFSISFRQIHVMKCQSKSIPQKTGLARGWSRLMTSRSNFRYGIPPARNRSGQLLGHITEGLVARFWSMTYRGGTLSIIYRIGWGRRARYMSCFDVVCFRFYPCLLKARADFRFRRGLRSIGAQKRVKCTFRRHTIRRIAKAVWSFFER